MKTITLALIAFMLLNCSFCFGQAGTLDSSFSKNGKVTGPTGGGNAIALLADGKIIVAGNSPSQNYSNITVVKYRSNGSLDKHFGLNGAAIMDFGTASEANCMAIQADGKIIAAGAGSDDFALVRLNADGQPDSSFGQNGKVYTDFYGGKDYVTSVAVQPDNKIIAIGTAWNEAYEISKIALARYNTNGTLDHSFGEKGKIVVNMLQYYFDEGSAIVLQPNGKFIAVGYTYNTNTHYDFVLIRYKSNGTIDSSFGINGVTITDINYDFDVPTAAGVQSKGKIVVAGYSDLFNGAIALARYTKNGILDSSFGTNGKVTTVVRGYDDRAYDITIQPDNKIVTAGYSQTTSGKDFVLIRYKSNGKIDKTFGNKGIVITDFAVDDIARSVALQSDGKIVVGGSSDGRFVVARYNNSLLPDSINKETISASKREGNILSSPAIKIYPNPVQSVLSIEFDKQDAAKKSISFYDMNGKLFLTKPTEGNTHIDVKQIPAGGYLIKITDEEGKLLYTEKVIKQ